MRLTLTLKTVAAVAVLLAGSSPAFADDLNPPPWARGGPGTTFQQWEFSGPSPTPPPDVVNNPYGMPSLHAYPGTNQFWVDLWGGHQGMWPLSGTVEVDIPNRPQPFPYKDIWVQLTWAKQVPSSTPVVWDFLHGVYGSLVNEIVLGPAPTGFWYHSTFLIHLEPNPASEIVKIDGTVVLDELVIDTICAPEPATIALLGFAALAILRRR
jgi:hypothetical protein